MIDNQQGEVWLLPKYTGTCFSLKIAIGCHLLLHRKMPDSTCVTGVTWVVTQRFRGEGLRNDPNHGCVGDWLLRSTNKITAWDQGQGLYLIKMKSAGIKHVYEIPVEAKGQIHLYWPATSSFTQRANFNRLQIYWGWLGKCRFFTGVFTVLQNWHHNIWTCELVTF